MAPVPAKSRMIDALIGGAAAGYIGLVERTSQPPPLMERYAATLTANHPMIIAMWHGQFMLLPTLARLGIPTKAMLALHRDAEGLAHALKRFGIELIRGAGASAKGKDRGGANAFRAAVQALDGGYSVAMTADVPPGPARRAGHGIVTLAKVSGRPILPVAMASSRYWALPTWSRMTVNLPGSQLGASFGTPIHVPADATPDQLEALRQEVERQMNIATVDAYNRAGVSHLRATPPAALTAAGERMAPGRALKLYEHGARLFGATVAPLFVRLRERRGKEDGNRRPERFGIVSIARPRGLLVWLHAASVGETMAILPLIDGLRQARPDAGVLLTTGTLTSAHLAAQRLPPCCIHQFVPLDVPRFVARFLDHWRPDLAVFVESEIWPNLILQSAARGVPMTLVNARMSKTSFRRWRGAGSVSRPLFNRFAAVLAQSREFADRFTALGATGVVTTGNLKFDAPPLPVDASLLERMRRALAGRPVFLAASTHADEERIVAEAHTLVRLRRPNLLTIIVPRHPERGAEIAAELKAGGFSAQRRSQSTEMAFDRAGEKSGIVIADTLGELGTWFALAPVAFIGKSLSHDGGGHNPIEAVRHGAAVLTGPKVANFEQAYKALFAAKGAVEVKTAAELANEILRLLEDEAAAERLRAAAAAACDKLAGALAKTVAALVALLPPAEPVATADAPAQAVG